MDDHHPHVYKYLPEPVQELPRVPKQYIANVCAAILEDKFANWVKIQMDNRHQKVVEKGDLMIQMDPKMAEVFKQSQAVSSKCLSALS